MEKINSPAPLPIGTDSYKKTVSEHYYVDKTLFIKELLDDPSRVKLFTRPRRFGKTLNMDMVKTFFEKTDKDTSVYFRNMKIWGEGEKYTSEQGMYPVIFMSLKTACCNSWDETYHSLVRIIADEFRRHKELQKSDKVDGDDLSDYNAIRKRESDPTEISASLLLLTRMLKDHYGTAPIVLIDEYDAPIQAGYEHGYYDEAVSFVRDFFSNGLKTNGENIKFAMMTGVVRIAQESIFSGLNNVSCYGVTDRAFSQYFGFTHDEVKKILGDFGCPEKYDEVCEWYNGYRFGDTEIFNPWSVLCYISRECTPDTYWVSTSRNGVIGSMMDNLNKHTADVLLSLMEGKAATVTIRDNIVYRDLMENPSNIYSLLLAGGYLKAIKKTGTSSYEVMIPNREIKEVYSEEIISKLSPDTGESVSDAIRSAIFARDTVALEKSLREYLISTVSYLDYTKEYFYHALLTGILACMTGDYEIYENIESGLGRPDICMRPRDAGRCPGVIMEIKRAGDGDDLEALAEEGLRQTEEKKYGMSLADAGVTDIIEIGIAFRKKDVAVTAKETKRQ